MKLLLATLFLLFTFSGIGQNSITGVTWKSSGRLFESIQSYYELNREKENADFSEQWGYSVVFHEDGTFTTSYSAPCGNDCFTSVSGTYTIIKEKYLEIFVSTIDRNGFCSQKDEQPEKVMGTYLFQVKDGTLFLKHK